MSAMSVRWVYDNYQCACGDCAHPANFHAYSRTHTLTRTTGTAVCCLMLLTVTIHSHITSVHSLLPAHCCPFTNVCSLLSIHYCLLTTAHSLLPAHYCPFTAVYSILPPFTAVYSPLLFLSTTVHSLATCARQGQYDHASFPWLDALR
jgi:hypothetical protein